MAESTLAKALPELRLEVARFLGYPVDTATITANATILAEIDQYIKDGYSRFLFGAQLAEEKVTHKWSFLTPQRTMNVGPGDVLDVSDNGTTLNDLATIKYNVALDTAVASADVLYRTGLYVTTTMSIPFRIVTFTSTTSLVAQLATVPDVLSGIFTISAEQYAMPDDFGGAIDRLTYKNDNQCVTVAKVGGETFRIWRQNRLQGDGEPYTGAPEIYCIQPIQGTTASTGQRWEMLLGPAPDQDYLLEMEYEVIPNMLTTALPYHLGGPRFAQIVEMACISAAEIKRERRYDGPMNMQYMTMLRTAILEDRSISRQDVSGPIRSQWGDGYRSGARGSMAGGRAMRATFTNDQIS